jgi:hypothetical protein
MKSPLSRVRWHELVSRELDLWAYQRGGTLDFSELGKPTDNSFIDAFGPKNGFTADQ